MGKQQFYSGIGAAAAMLILILDGRTALAGAKEGLALAVTTVIPSLFPFFFLSVLLTGSLLGQKSRLLQPLGRLFGLPSGAESLLIPAFLGGYPTGAQSVAAAAGSGRISRRDANNLLAFCSNAGPSFLFGMAGTMFSDPAAPWLLWGIHISGALFASRFFRCEADSVYSQNQGVSVTASSALKKAITLMANVCGWVILFRIVIAFLDRWVSWLLPVEAQVLLSGLLELTNGVCRLPEIRSAELRFVLCSVMLSLGGVCVTMQTVSVTQGLSRKYYYAGKALQAVFSTVISCLMVSPYRAIAIAATAFYLLIPVKTQKRSSNRAAVGV